MEDGEIDLPIILPVLPGMQNNLRDQDMGLAEVDLKICIGASSFSITALSIEGFLFAALSSTKLCIECHLAEFCISFIEMLNGIRLSVFMLNVIRPSVVAPSLLCLIK